MAKIIDFNNPGNVNPEEEGWEEDNDVITMDHNEMSDFVDGLQLINMGLNKIIEAVGIDYDQEGL